MSHTPKLTPPNRFWEQDLPDRVEEVGAGKEKPALYGNLNHLSSAYLEISRADNVMRGAGIVGGMIGLLMVPLGLFVIFLTADLTAPNGELDPTLIFVFIFVLALLLGVLFFIPWPFRIDFSRPRDEPVRFNSEKGKVYVYGFEWNWNPFGRWRAVTRVFDWQTIEAEITKQVGSTGRTIITRYALELAVCKPGTYEVVERIVLARSSTFDQHLRDMWAFIRQYMNDDIIPDDHPTPTPQPVGLSHSVARWVPYLDFSAEGLAAWRKPAFFIANILFIPMFPILMIFAIGHYIATKLAPEPRWPADIDAESRSAKSA